MLVLLWASLANFETVPSSSRDKVDLGNPGAVTVVVESPAFLEWSVTYLWVQTLNLKSKLAFGSYTVVFLYLLLLC